MRLSLRQLEVFDAIARTGSVVKAAQSIGLSQSATSLSLRDLENNLGAPLFLRHGKKLLINENGERLRLRANSLIRQISEIESLMDDRSLQGTLKVGASDTIGNYILPTLCADFMRTHAQVRMELVVEKAGSVMDGLENMSLDLGFIDSSCNRHALHVRPWIKDEVVFFCAPTHRLAGRKRVPVAELERETWFLQPPDHSARTFVVPYIGRYIRALNIGFVSGSAEAVKGAVAAGSGVGCLSRIVLAPELESGQLRTIDVRELDFSRIFNIITRKDSYQTELQRAFVDFVAGPKPQAAVSVGRR
jgi:DNA-binding transcriptional LysR family regulator